MVHCTFATLQRDVHAPRTMDGKGGARLTVGLGRHTCRVPRRDARASLQEERGAARRECPA
eukprot:scaffold113977_cov28-Tisochrysis_lutea.AAC.5